MKACILYIKLVYPDVPEKSLLDPEKSILLSGISSYKDYEVFAFGTPGMRKLPSLGRIFSQVEPKDDDTYILELGAILPDLLPNINDELDYTVDVIDDDNNQHMLCVSNQMIKVINRIGEEQYHVLLPRCNIDKLHSEGSSFAIQDNAPEELQRTMVTARFQITGNDAEDALENNIDRIVEKFISIINRFLGANQMLKQETDPFAVPSAYDRTTFGCLYLIVIGKDNKIAHGRLALNVNKVALQPISLNGSAADKLVAFLNGSAAIDDVQSMAVSAMSALQGGLLRYGLLLTVVLAEMATARFVGKHLQEHGVSKKKWDDLNKDFTYSMMLNTQLHALSPAHLKPDREILGVLNRGRKVRNDLMHKGTFELTSAEVHHIHQTTLRYLRYLEQLEQWYEQKSNDQEEE